VCEKDKVTENKGKMDKIAQILDGKPLRKLLIVSKL
jgi:hypothetical protein